MLESFKDKFMTVIQDGLSSNNNLRQTLSEVQNIRRNIFRDHDLRPKKDTNVNYEAGSDLLGKFKEQWIDLHRTNEENAVAAKQIDSLISDIHNTTQIHLTNASDFCQSLAALPKVIAGVDECIEQLGEILTLLMTVESEITNLEDLVDRQQMAQRKNDHYSHLGLYKEKKLAALEATRATLASQSMSNNAKREQNRLQELRRIQAIAGDTYTVTHSPRGSVSISSVTQIRKEDESTNNVTLEQVDLETDNTELDEFLNS